MSCPVVRTTGLLPRSVNMSHARTFLVYFAVFAVLSFIVRAVNGEAFTTHYVLSILFTAVIAGLIFCGANALAKK
jgi:hypothetical protein